MPTQPAEHFRSDVAIVGWGGVAGASLGAALARAGLGRTIVEREAHFRDRVHGESIMPRGVGEADRLGVLPALKLMPTASGSTR